MNGLAWFRHGARGLVTRFARQFAIMLDMPVICRFLGIAIAILYREHEPPHFHAIYGEHEVSISIRDGSVTGRFPRRALKHVLEWLDLHRAELLEDWGPRSGWPAFEAHSSAGVD